eukprot:4361797-Karenia_brevis.AAC.1
MEIENVPGWTYKIYGEMYWDDTFRSRSDCRSRLGDSGSTGSDSSGSDIVVAVAVAGAVAVAARAG